MKRALTGICAAVGSLVGASVLARRRKQRRRRHEPRGAAEFPPLAMEPRAPNETATADTAGDELGTGSGWVSPGDDGSCPPSHPVKAKESSGIYHVEGGASYERTNADRCYLSPTTAEADGYRAAKA